MSNRTKNITSAVVVVAAVAAGFYFFGASSTTTQIENGSTSELTAETQTISRENAQDGYTIETTRPTFTSNGRAVAFLNNDIEAFLQAEIDEFTTQAREYSQLSGPQNTPELESLPPSTFHGDHEVLFLSPQLVSVRFTITTYMSGAAHPFNYTKGFNYNVAKKQQVTLDDVFKPNSSYIERLSERAISTLLIARANQQGNTVDQQQEEWIREGASPKKENFTNWAFSDNLLIIYFNPYQVAPYAAGIIEAPVPWEDVQGLLDPGGPIAPLLTT